MRKTLCYKIFHLIATYYVHTPCLVQKVENMVGKDSRFYMTKYEFKILHGWLQCTLNPSMLYNPFFFIGMELDASGIYLYGKMKAVK